MLSKVQSGCGCIPALRTRLSRPLGSKAVASFAAFSTLVEDETSRVKIAKRSCEYFARSSCKSGERSGTRAVAITKLSGWET